MSLQVWLPLNGNLNNQGCSFISLLGSPNSWNTDGKIGKCATFAGNTSNVIYNNTTDFNYTDNFSWSIWIKTNYTAGSTQYIFTVGRADYGGLGYGLQCESATSCIVRYGSALWSINVTSGEWTHIAFTKSGTTCKIYKNGSIISTQTFSGTDPTYSDGNGLGLGCFHYIGGDIYPYYGKINDFRIYDHALSPKEVKEISKALIIHYPLDGNGIGVPNLCLNTTTFSGWSVDSGWTLGTSDDETKMYSFSRTGATYNNWVRIIPTLKVDGNNYPNGITVSMDILTPDKSAINQKCLGSLQQYNEYGSRTGWYEPGWDLTNVVNNQWSRIKFTFSKSALLTNSQGLVYAYTMFSFQLVQNGNISIRKIKIEEGSTATPWCPNPNDALYATLGYNSTTEYDTSGFRNNGTKTKAMNSSSNTSKYSSSTIFDGSNDCILTPFNAAIGNSPTAFTINTWIYKTSIGTKNWQTIFGGPSGFELEARKSNESNPVVVIYNWGQGQSAYEFNKWNMVTMVWTTSDVKLYINGELKVTGNTASIPSGNYYVGSWRDTTSQNYEGQMSDFRLYATALSADDIKELYKTSASISDNGTMFGYEFNEE